MNEFDFSQLQQLRTPADWVEKAVNIPQKKQKSRMARLRPQWFAAAAALVVVAAAVLTLLSRTGQTAVPLRPTPSAPVTPAVTATSAPDNGTQPVTTSPVSAAASSVPPTTSAGIATPSVPSPTSAAQSSPTAAPSAPTTAPVTAPPTTAPVTHPVTVPATTSASMPATMPATIPATVPETEPQEQPAATPTAPPGEEIDLEYFCGKLSFLTLTTGDFADSDTVYATIRQAGMTYEEIPIPMKTVSSDFRQGVLSPYESGILLYVGDDACTVTVRDDRGHSVTHVIRLTKILMNITLQL